MDIRTTKLELLKTILESENTDFIQKIAAFAKKEKNPAPARLYRVPYQFIIPKKKHSSK